MPLTFCSSCGAEIKADPEVVIPICTDCRFGETVGGQGPQWMVRRRGERPQGPYARERIVEWLKGEHLVATDEVARPGSVWKPLMSHEDFRAWFTVGDTRFQTRLAAIADRDSNRRQEAMHERSRWFVLVALMAAFGALPLVAWQTGITAVPEPWLAAGIEAWDAAHKRIVSTVRSATDKEAALKAVTESRQLPGNDLLAEIRTRVPLDQEPANLHLVRGRSLMQQARPEARDQALQELEKAAVLAPRDPVAIAALAEAYAVLSTAQAPRVDAAQKLFERADLLAADLPDVLRARANLALSSRAYAVALQISEECLRGDPENLECLHAKAVALMRLGMVADAQPLFTALIKKAPNIPRFQEVACEAALESGDYPMARAAVRAFLASSPQIAGGHAMASRYYWYVGEYALAYREAREAGQLDLAQWEARLLAAELALPLEGPETATIQLEAMVSDPTLAGNPVAPRVYLAAAHANRRLGRHDRALEMANKAMESRIEWAPAALALALVHRARGDLANAEKVLKQVLPDGLSPTDAGRYLGNLGRIYQEQGRDKAALATYESALTADPHNALARVGTAEVYLRLSNLSKAVDAIRGIAPTDFEQPDTHPPYDLCPQDRWSFGPLVADLRKAVADDLRFAPMLAGIEGILAYLAGDLGLAESRLRAALAENDEDDASRAFLVRILIRRGAWSEARTLLERLSSTQTSAGLYTAWLGLTQAHLGEYKVIDGIFDRSFQNAGTLAGPHRMRAKALYLAGRKEEAASQARVAWEIDADDHAARRLLIEYATE